MSILLFFYYILNNVLPTIQTGKYPAIVTVIGTHIKLFFIQMRPQNIDFVACNRIFFTFDLNVESCSCFCIRSGVRYNRRPDSTAPDAATCIIGGRIHRAPLFSVPTSGPQLVYQRSWYVLFCLWKSAYKRSLAAYRKE